MTVILVHRFIAPVIGALIIVSTLALAKKPIVVSTGLRNLGNTCYMNAQLQCHFHIPRIRHIVKQGLQTGSNNCNEHVQEAVGLQALRQVFGEMELAISSNKKASPAILCQVLGISTMEQQDSQEFWKLLLPTLELPALVDLYQGAFEDYITSIDGKHEKRREEAFLDLSLDVTHKNVERSLQVLFGEPELLSEKEGNGWRPEKGMPKVDALKGSLLRVQGLPSLLSLHLKRFQYDWQVDQTSKSHSQFKFDKILDLREICTDFRNEAEELVVYDLQSIIIHTGEFGGGHYYAYVRPDIRADTWYRINDQHVDEVCFQDVFTDAIGGRTNEPKKSGFFRWLSRRGSSYGWGGRAASAYLLQYVKRSEINALYDDDEQ